MKGIGIRGLYKRVDYIHTAVVYQAAVLSYRKSFIGSTLPRNPTYTGVFVHEASVYCQCNQMLDWINKMTDEIFDNTPKDHSYSSKSNK